MGCAHERRSAPSATRCAARTGWASLPLPDMDPIIVASTIAAGSTGVVAIAGFFINWLTTKRTVSAGTENTIRALEAARSDRIWDKKAATYTDAIAGLRHMQGVRSRQLTSTIVTEGPPPKLSDPPVNWADLEARILAFASPTVLEAFQAASDAGLKTRHLYREWDEARRPQSGVMRSPDELRQALRAAVQAADAKDDALIDAMRADLYGEAGRPAAYFFFTGCIRTTSSNG